MSFWNTSENAPVEAGETFESGGPIEPMEDGTQAVCVINEIKWDEYQGDSYINAQWEVVDHPEHTGRKVYHKIRVKDADQKKRDKHLQMLATIDKLCGGQLMASGKEPNDMDLHSALVGKPVAVTFGLWEFTGDDGQHRSGNWVRAVGPSAGTTKAPQQSTGVPWGGSK